MNNSKLHISTPMGIHRVMKEPYDDREIFESIDDLMNYCWNGARYNGQKISCIMGSEGSNGYYIQNFTINNDFPIADFPNGEIVIKYFSNVPYIMIYCCSSKQIMYNKNKEHFNYLSNPSLYSILSLCKTFTTKDQPKYYFKASKIYKEDDIYKNAEASFSLDKNVFERYLVYNNDIIINSMHNDMNNTYVTISSDKVNNTSAYIQIETNDFSGSITSSASILFNIIPNIVDPNTEYTALFLEATDYIKAMGVDLYGRI